MDFLGAAALALVAGVLLALSPRDTWSLALKAAAVFAVVTLVLALLLPPATAALFGARDELRAYVPSPTGAVAETVGFSVRRGGMALLVGLMLSRLVGAGLPRAAVIAVGALGPAALEVLLQTDAIRSLATVFPPVVIANLLAPEVAPPFFGGAVAAAWATRDARA